MRAIKYFANLLPNGNIPVPEEVKKELLLQKGEKLEVILSYITIKSKEEAAAKKNKKKLTLKEIDQIVHAIRSA
jgi:TusA-related sulfurtransferase